MTPAAPQHCPTPRELDDLELLLSGALAPLRTFNEPGSPVTLALPGGHAGTLDLVDPEGLPLARLESDGSLHPLSHAEFGPFRRLHLTPARARDAHAGATWVAVDDALTEADAARLATVSGPIVLVALMGTGTSRLSPVALLRASLAAAPRVRAEVVAVPLAGHGDTEVDARLRAQVLAQYAAGDPVLDLVAERTDGEYLPEVAAIVERDRPAPDRQGLVLFFTGLSGSGKSTLARALTDQVLEQGDRTVTSLDGDVVRRHLSAGLTFSKADRETNIRRIGWVAAEIARHGGVAVCSPIAPFDETRQQVRQMVEDAGGAFFLIHVATPLEECERRDRKGLYAKARRGEIPEFTGISSPYEEPADAAVRVDTTGRTIEDALGDVEAALAEAGLLTFGAAPVAADPIKVLFVCTANICRSPMMQLQAATHPGIVATSAGVRGFTDHAMDQDMADAARDLGLDTQGFTSRPLEAAMLAEADLVLTAEAGHRAHILEEHPGVVRKVFTLGQFVRAAQALADRGLDLHGRELLAELGATRGAADPADDVADPYRQGPDAAAASAHQIRTLVDEAMTRLTGQRATVDSRPDPRG